MKLLYIGVFGVLGVYSRYFLSITVDTFAAHHFPFGTLTANLLGAFLAGLLVALSVHIPTLSPDLKTGLMVGLLGGFTTFSALCQQTVQLTQEGRPGEAAAYLLLSNAAGVACVVLGVFTAHKLTGA